MLHSLTKASADIIDNHLDNYLIRHFSVSAVSEFIRNEKSFERKYIFLDYDKDRSLASIIGSVYHRVLMEFFRDYKDGIKMTYEDLTVLALDFLNDISAEEYRPQKNKTIEQLKIEGIKALNSAIQNFYSEFESYAEEIKEILFVEEKFLEFIIINGIEIPLPLKGIPDLVFINKNGELAIIDHKCKKNYTLEKDINLHYSNGSIAYILLINAYLKQNPKIIKKYPKAKKGVQKFYYYENKYTQNRDGSHQIRQIPIDVKESGQLYEQIFFEGIMRLIEAVQNPDHIYLMNPSDFFVDGEEMVAFWLKTHMEGFEGFPNIPENTKNMLKKRRSDIRRSALIGIPKSIIKSFTHKKAFLSFNKKDMQNLTIQERIERRLNTFNYPIKVDHIISGYSCDTYLITISASVKASTIYSYRMDIANAAGVKDVRILPEQVEYKGCIYMAIEVNNKEHKTLTLSDSDIPEGNIFPLGKDNFGNVLSWSIDNPSTPHMMISGASGSGKSVAIKTIIEVAIKKGIPVTILDPKYEFLEQTRSTVINELEDIEKFMCKQVYEMNEIFKKSGATGATKKKQLIIFDESADCFARQAKEGYEEDEDGEEQKIRGFKTLEENVLILAQKARSAGIHIVLAAQRFSVKTLTGDAKANFPTRLCLTTSSAVDSRVMLEQDGAEKLNGKGDALFAGPGLGQPVRIQCFSSTK